MLGLQGWRSIIIDVRKRCHAGLDPAFTIDETPDQVRGDTPGRSRPGWHPKQIETGVTAKRMEIRMSALYFGDNLDVLREEIKDEAIDLIYLDPPFNSKI